MLKKSTMLAVLLSLVFPFWMNGQTQKERVYIWDFVDNKGQQTDLTDRITSEFEEALNQAKCYQVVERRRFDKVLAHIKNEKAIADLNDLSKSSRGEVKKITNAQIIVFGKVDDDIASGEYKISVTFQNFDSSKEVKSIRIRRGRIDDIESREDAMKELVKKICSSSDFLQDSQSYYERGFMKYSDKDYEGAFKDFKKVVDNDPTNYEAYNYCGVCLYHLGRCKDAIEYFDKAINLNKNLFQAYANRGDCKYIIGDKQGAINDHRIAAKGGNEFSQNWLKRLGFSVDDSIAEEQQNAPKPVYTFNIYGLIKTKEGIITKIEEKNYSRYTLDKEFVGEWRYYYLKIEQYKDGILCDVAELETGRQLGQCFPDCETINGPLAYSGKVFNGGFSVDHKDGKKGEMSIYWRPGKECKN
jgi:tetratricopeptide (TPR) repeat protein